MEVLFEYRGSRRQLSVSDRTSITGVVGSELQRLGKPRARVFTANEDLPSGRRASGERVKPEVYLLQKWSAQWDCYVDVSHCNEVCDGDRLAVIAKPKPPSKASAVLLFNVLPDLWFPGRGHSRAVLSLAIGEGCVSAMNITRK